MKITIFPSPLFETTGILSAWNLASHLLSSESIYGRYKYFCFAFLKVHVCLHCCGLNIFVVVKMNLNKGMKIYEIAWQEECQLQWWHIPPKNTCPPRKVVLIWNGDCRSRNHIETHLGRMREWLREHLKNASSSGEGMVA